MAVQVKVQGRIADLSLPSRVRVKGRLRPFKGKGQLSRKIGEFEGGRWEEFGWGLTRSLPKWALTLAEEKSLREELWMVEGKGKLGKWVGG